MENTNTAKYTNKYANTGKYKYKKLSSSLILAAERSIIGQYKYKYEKKTQTQIQKLIQIQILANTKSYLLLPLWQPTDPLLAVFKRKIRLKIDVQTQRQIQTQIQIQK